MMGRDHALTGAAAGATVALPLHLTGGTLAVFTVLCAGAATFPDIDHLDSTVAATFGILTEIVAWIIRFISRGHRHGTHSIIGVAAFTTGAVYAALYQAAGPLNPSGHPAWSLRELPAALIMTLFYAAALRALNVGGHHSDLIAAAGATATLWWNADLTTVSAGRWHVPLLALATCLGCSSHIAGDMITHAGCPIWWPFDWQDHHLLPKPMQITTNRIAEHWIVSPVLTSALEYALWRDTGARSWWQPHSPDAKAVAAGVTMAALTIVAGRLISRKRRRRLRPHAAHAG